MANAKTVALNSDRSLFTIGLGTRGARAKMTGTKSFDATKLPPNIVSFLIERGADIMLRQASQEAERVQLQEWAKKNGKKVEDAPPIARFPFDYARLEKDALAAMDRRIADWYKGDTGRDGAPMNALDRRASELIQAALRAAFVQAKKPVPEAADLDALVQRVLADPEKGQKYRDQAAQQLLEEQQRAAKAGADLADLIAA